MRPKGKPASLGELLGKSAGKELHLSDLPDLLGEKLPDLPYNRIGKYRLNNSLRLRFGPGFKNIPGIKNILEEFDKYVETESAIKINERANHGNND